MTVKTTLNVYRFLLIGKIIVKTIYEKPYSLKTDRTDRKNIHLMIFIHLNCLGLKTNEEWRQGEVRRGRAQGCT